MTIILFGCLSVLTILVVVKTLRGNGSRIRRALYPYPYTSDKGDRMFPPKGDKFGWTAYILIFSGVLIFLVIIASLIFKPDSEPPIWAIICAGMLFGFGGFLQRFSTYNGG